ncbi:MAG TPA: spore coat U domain-containing protein [Lysobacter sp.]|nr:spore coat U domain-containing protein [Lysobacter sp.]
MKRTPRFLPRIACACLALPLHAAACGVSVTPLTFGTINPLDRVPVESVATVTVSCPGAAAYTVSASAGGGEFVERRMSNGANALAYQLYTDPGHSQVWGDGSTGTAVISGLGDAGGSVHHVYGRVPAQPLAVPGAYADVLTVVVTY